jgi:CBS domain-containing protein
MNKILKMIICNIKVINSGGEYMQCSKIMTKNIKALHPESTAKEAILLMKELNCGVIPVVDRNNTLKGIVTDRDIALYIVLNDRDPEDTTLNEFMSTKLITCHPDNDVDIAIHKMSRYQVRRIPVVDDEFKLVGLISLGDVAVKVREEHETYNALEHISEPVTRGGL